MRPLSIRAIDWAFRQETDSPTGKLVLVKLADNANDDGECWPSQKMIARHTGLGRQTVNRHIKSLERQGLLRIEHRDMGKGAISNVYHLPIDHVPERDRGCPLKGQGGVPERDTNHKRREPPENQPPLPLLTEVMEAWNEITTFPRIYTLSPGRVKHLKSRLKDKFFSENWRSALIRARDSHFLQGKNNRQWVADFDWFIRPDTVAKIMEGRYDNKKETWQDPREYGLL